MNAAFAIAAWATLGAVYLEACMSLADRLHVWRVRRRSTTPVAGPTRSAAIHSGRRYTDAEAREIADGFGQL